MLGRISPAILRRLEIVAPEVTNELHKAATVPRHSEMFRRHGTDWRAPDFSLMTREPFQKPQENP